jgi:hypothetical protein
LRIAVWTRERYDKVSNWRFAAAAAVFLSFEAHIDGNGLAFMPVANSLQVFGNGCDCCTRGNAEED